MNSPVHLPLAAERPKTRGECHKGGSNDQRPCPWTNCFYHLGNEAATCVLDVAEQGGATLEEVGGYLGVTRERVRQIETGALRKLAKRMPRDE